MLMNTIDVLNAVGTHFYKEAGTRFLKYSST